VDWVRDEHPPCTTDPSWISKFATDDSAPDRLLRGRITRLEKLADLHGMRGSTTCSVKNALRQARLLGLVLVKERRIPGQKNLTNIISIVSKEWLGWLKLGVGVKRVTATDNHFVVTSAVAASLLIGANRHSSWREGIHSLHVGI
jgi:hypothetical protein